MAAGAISPRVLVLPPSNRTLAETVANLCGGSVQPVASVADIAQHYESGSPLIGLMASGILIRAIAPHLSDKTSDAPVLAVANDGSTVVPLVGGHQGANDLARVIAVGLGCAAAITTASDCVGSVKVKPVAFDCPPPGWRLLNPVDHKAFAAAYIKATPETQAAARAAFGRDQVIEIAGIKLSYAAPDLAVGLGSARGCSVDELEALVNAHLPSADRARVAGFYSVTLKNDELGMLALAEKWQRPIRFFTPEQLADVAVPNPSAVVAAEVGTPSVSEAAALSANGGRLLVEKQKSANATVAIAQSTPFEGHLNRSMTGTLTIVGTGPGDLSHMSPAALAAVSDATDLVGFGLYLDLLGSYTNGKQLHARALGEEELRCRLALDLALEGRMVALVCSGDPAIYAMAALVYELLASDLAKYKSVEVLVEPGISAFQMCAAKSGALIGHDFCCISLSNLLTPWETIERRIQAATDGDFVVAFYNPVSQRRDWQLAKAREILLTGRSANTPVVIGWNLGREGERITHTTLGALDPTTVDMLSLVLVGSSQSRFVSDQGQEFAYTPRGYAAKEGSTL